MLQSILLLFIFLNRKSNKNFRLNINFNDCSLRECLKCIEDHSRRSFIRLQKAKSGRKKTLFRFLLINLESNFRV